MTGKFTVHPPCALAVLASIVLALSQGAAAQQQAAAQRRPPSFEQQQDKMNATAARNGSILISEAEI